MNEQSKQLFCKHALVKGITPARLDQTAKDIAAAAPSEAKEKYGDDIYALADAYLDQFLANQQNGGNGGNGGNNNPPSTQNNTVAKPELSAGALQAIAETTKALSSKFANAEKTTITKIVVNMPMMDTYLDPNAKVVPFSHITTENGKKEVADKLKLWEERLVTEGDKAEEYKKNFNMVKEAYEKNKALPIFIQKDPTKRSAIGYIINTPSATTNAMEEKMFNIKKLTGYVTVELGGYIPNHGEGTLGCKFRTAKVRKKDAQGHDTGVKEEVPTLRFYNKNECMKKADMVVAASMVKTDSKGKPVTKKDPVPVAIDASFYIYAYTKTSDGKIVDKKDSHGNRVKQKITVKGGYANYPEFVRTSKDFQDVFGRTASENQFAAAPTESDMPEYRHSLQTALAYFAGSSNAEKYGASDFAEVINSMAGDSAPSSDL